MQYRRTNVSALNVSKIITSELELFRNIPIFFPKKNNGILAL